MHLQDVVNTTGNIKQSCAFVSEWDLLLRQYWKMEMEMCLTHRMMQMMT